MALNPFQKPYQWVFQEYPKMVYKNEDEYPHKGTTVHSPDEEFAHLGYLEKDRFPKVESVNVLPDTGERKFLISLLTKIKAKFNEDASIEELRDILDICSNQPEPESVKQVEQIAEVQAYDPIEVLADPAQE